MPGDQPPPLVVAPEEPSVQDQKKVIRRRKRRRAKHNDTEWENAPAQTTAPDKDKGNMIWQLVVGTVLFAALVVWVAVTLDADQTVPVVVGDIKPQEATAHAPPLEKPSTWYDPKELQALCKAFLEASTVEELLPTVRDRERLETSIREYHSRKPLSSPGLQSVSVLSQPAQDARKVVVLSVQTRRYERMILNLCDTPDGIKVDWESWIGYSEMPWEQMKETKPTSPVMVRAVLSRSDYFNMDFADDSRWRCYRLLSADGDGLIYGYLDASSTAQRELIERIDRTALAEFRVTLKLRYPNEAKSDNQAMIVELVSEGWFLPDETR